MGYIFEELVRKFSKQSNETAGEHFTPREVIELMVEILLAPDTDLLQDDNRVVTLFDQRLTRLLQYQNKISGKHTDNKGKTENLWIFRAKYSWVFGFYFFALTGGCNVT